jgi:hypothetical protein
MICIDHKILVSRSNQEGCGGGGVWNIWERGDTVQELVWRSELKISLGRRRHRCKVEYQIYL